MGNAERKINEQIDLCSDGSDLELLIGYNLKRAYMIVQNDFRETLGEGGLTPRAFAALALVVQSPKVTQSELARELGVERSGLVAIVDDLEKKAFLKRVNVPGDRRIQALVPTEHGKSAYQKALTAVNEHERKLFAIFSEDEKGQLLHLLKKIRTAF